MANPRYEVIVIGSGPGGSACAAFLQKRGIQTLLVEKNGFVGGKMASVTQDGYAYDLFAHRQVPMRQPAFENIFQDLGVGKEFNPALTPADAAPPGKQVLVSGTICSPNPEAREIGGLWKRMDEQLARLFPEISEAIARRECAGPREISNMTRDSVLPGQGGECVGLGQIVGQCGKMKPSQTAPVRGLFYAGADAGAAGMGTHQAACSGIEAARLAQHYLNKLYKTQ